MEIQFSKVTTSNAHFLTLCVDPTGCLTLNCIPECWALSHRLLHNCDNIGRSLNLEEKIVLLRGIVRNSVLTIKWANVIIAQHCKHLKFKSPNTELFRGSKDVEVGINLSKNFPPITSQISVLSRIQMAFALEIH
jgi:hypothetical protein